MIHRLSLPGGAGEGSGKETNATFRRGVRLNVRLGGAQFTKHNGHRARFIFLQILHNKPKSHFGRGNQYAGKGAGSRNDVRRKINSSQNTTYILKHISPICKGISPRFTPSRNITSSSGKVGLPSPERHATDICGAFGPSWPGNFAGQGAFAFPQAPEATAVQQNPTTRTATASDAHKQEQRAE